jgi:hypothetical protein
MRDGFVAGKFGIDHFLGLQFVGHHRGFAGEIFANDGAKIGHAHAVNMEAASRSRHAQRG